MTLPQKQHGVFLPAGLIARARDNAAKHGWAAAMVEDMVSAAEPWMGFSDDELWNMMFGHTITRAWTVWSNGHCPACREPVVMYNWEMDALVEPWKVRCPHCSDRFPKNDFHRFYLSGLDEHGVFDPMVANRSLLFNSDHPDPSDPLHTFGVDDGEGYVEGEKRWRFIGAYLVYGQWYQVVLAGIKNLAAAHVVTGKQEYAHAAAVLLDRVADLYPLFDFAAQATAYETDGHRGYVTMWHNACEDTREMAMAYDQIFDAVRDDAELVAYLGGKAAERDLPNPKSCFEDVQRNIEQRIFLDAMENRAKIESNQPRTDMAVAIMRTVLDRPEDRADIEPYICETFDRATAVDGLTGEKGLANYAAFAAQLMAPFLALYGRRDPQFLPRMFERCPALRHTWRFHLDTWCLHKYYPLIGDTGWFGRAYDEYQGVRFRDEATFTPMRGNGLRPSMYTFFMQLYELTGDEAYVQLLYQGNGSTVDGLPHNLFAEDTAAFQRRVSAIIAEHGPLPKVDSVNKQEWHLAILRDGHGPDARALWIGYDRGARHAHADGMNLGLFAKGLDLMPDFGYPPVQYGGWQKSPRTRWYKMTASHNTVVVDGCDQTREPVAGRTTLWADGAAFKAVRATGRELTRGKQYERTAALVRISPEDAYVLDVFRVVGGKDHAKFTHSNFGTITTHGLDLRPVDEYGHGTQMRNFRCDPSPAAGWSVDWKIEDRYGLIEPDADIHFRYTDLTRDAQAFTAEPWLNVGGTRSIEDAWIPCILVRRRSDEAPLASTFVSVMEPYAHKSSISAVRRLTLTTPDGCALPDSGVAVRIELAAGETDLIIARDVEDPLGRNPQVPEVFEKESGVQTDAELCLVRFREDGSVTRVALCRGRSFRVGRMVVTPSKESDILELAFDGNTGRVVCGNPDDLEHLVSRGPVAS